MSSSPAEDSVSIGEGVGIVAGLIFVILSVVWTVRFFRNRQRQNNNNSYDNVNVDHNHPATVQVEKKENEGKEEEEEYDDEHNSEIPTLHYYPRYRQRAPPNTANIANSNIFYTTSSTPPPQRQQASFEVVEVEEPTDEDRMVVKEHEVRKDEDHMSSMGPGREIFLRKEDEKEEAPLFPSSLPSTPLGQLEEEFDDSFPPETP